jgi:integrase
MGVSATASLAQHRWHNSNSGEQGRHHLDASVIQQAVRRAVLVSGIITPATSHSFRHSFTTQLLECSPWECAAQPTVCNMENATGRFRPSNQE